MSIHIDLLPWDHTGLDLLRAMNNAAQKQHLGGIETEAKLLERHERYLGYHRPGAVEMLRIERSGEIVGSIGYWEITRNGAPAYEAGWEVRKPYHGLGIGRLAAEMLMARLRPVARNRHLFAFPTPENPGSNGICRRLGFEMLGLEEIEYPAGFWSPHNVWRLDLGEPATIGAKGPRG